MEGEPRLDPVFQARAAGPLAAGRQGDPARADTGHRGGQVSAEDGRPLAVEVDRVGEDLVAVARAAGVDDGDVRVLRLQAAGEGVVPAIEPLGGAAGLDR